MADEAFSKVIERAKLDLEFRQKLSTAPREALKEYNFPEEVVRSFVLPNFSWIIEGKLAGVGRPKSEEALNLLKEAGVTALITLTEQPLPVELLTAFEFHTFHSPITDFTAPSLEQVNLILAEANRLLAENQVVAVHCAAGLGRTGTILACYLVTQGLSASEAIATIRSKRPGSIETPEQEQLVSDFEQYFKEKTV